MNLLLLLLLASLPVTEARNLAASLRTCDFVHYDVSARCGAEGVEVACDLRLKRLFPGPVYFLLSSAATRPRVERDGTAVPVRAADEKLETLLAFVAKRGAEIPSLYAVDTDGSPGETFHLSIRYRWKPSGKGLAYADAAGVETHLSPFWLPSMAGETFTATLRVVPANPDQAVFATGRRLPPDGNAQRFEADSPVQLLSLFVGDLEPHRLNRHGRLLEVWLPQGSRIDPAAALRDLARCFDLFETWFGPYAPKRFSLLEEPRSRPAPSFCGGSFAVLAPGHPPQGDRARWLHLLAHECSHVWWGYRVTTAALGEGGTFLREGLAEWSGVKAVGAFLGSDATARLFADERRIYLGSADLRQAPQDKRVVFANEPTLLDATYLDPPRIAYLRGALVLRYLEKSLGSGAFFAGLRRYAASGGKGMLETPDDLARALDPGDTRGVGTLVSYYARTSRLPDFRLQGVHFGEESVEGRIVCNDPQWPGGMVAWRVATPTGPVDRMVYVAQDGGEVRFAGLRVQGLVVDPDRLTLDPILSNQSAKPGG